MSGRKSGRRSPTSGQLQAARANLVKAIADERDQLKIGRTAADDFARIGTRYAGAYRVCELLRGAPSVIAALERELQRHAAVEFGGRVLNRNRGGGPASPEPVHVLYVALFRDRAPTLPAVELLRTNSLEPGRGPWTVVTPGSRPTSCVPCAASSVAPAPRRRAAKRDTSVAGP
jgi:hypothetical protein